MGLSYIEDQHNRTIYNVEDNISAMNISKYDFVYENIEVEMEEGKSMIRSPLISADQKILAGLNSPSQSQPKPKPPEDVLKKDSVWQGRTNLLKMASLPKDSAPSSNLNSNTVSRKGSIASTAGANYARERVYSLPDNAQAMEAFQFVRDVSDNSSESSKKNALQMIDSIKHKPKKTSHFQHESEGNTETGNSIGDEPHHETLLKPNMTLGVNVPGKSLAKSQSVHLPSAGIQEADSKFEQSNVTRGEIEDRNKLSFMKATSETRNLLTPPPSQTEVDKQNIPEKHFRDLSSEQVDGSKSPNLKGAVLKRTQTSVIETNKLDKTRDEEGQKKINQYVFIKDIGK